LGLAVVQQVVTRHGGTIEVESVPERGTTFHLYFRRCDPPAQPAESSEHAGVRRVRTIVLVEDDPNVSAGLQAVLDLEDIATHAVTLGADAEEAVARNHPDAVVLDRGLPDMDGLEVARRLLARWPDLPIVFSTGHGDREDLEGMAHGSRVAYLLKPYSVSALLDTLDRMLREE
jgi:two-component system, cell cycle sensor histidine kinase and response regulator CckA